MHALRTGQRIGTENPLQSPGEQFYSLAA